MSGFSMSKMASGVVGAAGGSGTSIPTSQSSIVANSPISSSSIASYKRGGKVRKTGLARLHKGERVLTKKQTRRYDKQRRKRGAHK